MSEYPSINPADVREGDVVEADYALNSTIAYTVTGPAWQNVQQEWHVGNKCLLAADAIRLVSRPAPPEPFPMGTKVRVVGHHEQGTVAGWDYYPAWGEWLVRVEDAAGAGSYALRRPKELELAPPEPPLRVGDWVTTQRGTTGQITEVLSTRPRSSPYQMNSCWWEPDELTRIEPPVGWPVAVPDPDAPGGVRWYARRWDDTSFYDPTGDHRYKPILWPDLLAAGGIPAPAPGGAA